MYENTDTEVLRKYLEDGGGFLSKRFDIGVRTWERDGKVQKRRFVYMNSGKELSMNEITLMVLSVCLNRSWVAVG